MASIRARTAVILLGAVAALLPPLSGCGEETYKVSRGTDELSKPAAARPADPKAARRIERAEKVEAETLKKGKLH